MFARACTHCQLHTAVSYGKVKNVAGRSSRKGYRTRTRAAVRERRCGACLGPRVTVRREPVTGVSRLVAPGPTHRLMGLGPAA